MNARAFLPYCLLPVACCLLAAGCHYMPRIPHEQKRGPAYDRPFPLGQVTDSFWETQQTNAEASDFVFYDHEFVGETEELAPGGKKHLVQVALRLPQVPFPIVVEQSAYNRKPQLDRKRRQVIVNDLTRLGLDLDAVDQRVVIAPAFAPGITAMEGESAYYRTLDSGGFGGGGGVGRRFGGRGGTWR